MSLNVKQIPKWKYSGQLTRTRVYGKIGFNINGNSVDVWIRDKNGDINWYGIDVDELKAQLEKNQTHGKSFVLSAESDMKLAYGDLGD